MWKSTLILFFCIALSAAKPKPKPKPQAQVKVVATNDCSAKGDPDIVVEDASEKSCIEFADDGYRCAPFYACKGGEIIVNGAGLTNIRSSDTSIVSRKVALDPSLSKCDAGLDICCRLPEWSGVPPDTFVEIPKPPTNCKPSGVDYYDDYYTSLACEVNGVTYGDLDEIPSETECNSCYCDYGEIACTKDLCGDKAESLPEIGDDGIGDRNLEEELLKMELSDKTSTTATTPATTPKTTPESFDYGDGLDEKSNLPEEPLEYGGYVSELSNEIFAPSYTVVDTPSCDSFGNPKETMVQPEPSLCKDLAEDGFRCVPYYGCKNGILIVNGKGLIDIRQVTIRNIDPFNSKCPGDLEICCKHPDWAGVPLETMIEIKKPSLTCKTDIEKQEDLENSICTKNGQTYEDLAAVPSDDDCNTCFCDFGLVICTEMSCGGSTSGDQEQSKCTKSGVNYEDLASVPSDDCNTCFCDFGKVVCTERGCDSDVDQPTCTKNGVTYQDLASIPSEDCNMCYCDVGSVVCTERLCDASYDEDQGTEESNLLFQEISTDNTKFRSGNPYHPKCGQRNLKGVGVAISYPNTTVHFSQFGEWPNMCAILNQTADGKEEFVCGASLIDRRVVLSVAHYLKDNSDTSKFKYVVRCGEWDTQSTNEPLLHQDRVVKKILLHPGYTSDRLAHNDVSILVLEQPFELDRHIDTICLPSQDDVSHISLEECIATGWGKDRFGNDSNYQVVLKEVQMDMVDHKTCEKKLQGTRLGSKFTLDKSFNCAGGEAGVDVCTGDGGGPLVCPGKGILDIRGAFGSSHFKTYYQVGITSWGIGCGKEGIPGVYADVSESLCFIDYATKCALGQDVNLFNVNNCPNWPNGRYCELLKELKKTNIELRKIAKAKAKQSLINQAIRKQRVLAQMKNQYADMIYSCGPSNVSREDFVIKCR